MRLTATSTPDAAGLDKAIALAPDSPGGYLARGKYWFERGSYADAADDFERYERLTPALDVHPLLAASYLMQAKTTEALTLYQKSIETDHSVDPRVLADGAYVAYANGDRTRASTWAKLSLALQPDTPTGSYVLALLSWDDKKYQEALNPLLAIEGHAADSALYPFFSPLFNHSIHADIARLYVALEQISDAQNFYDVAIQDAPHWITPRLELAQLYIAQSDTDSARLVLTEVLRIADNPDDRAHVTQLLLQLGQLNSTPGATATPDGTPTPGAS